MAVSLKVKGEANRAEATAAWHRLMAGVEKPKPETMTEPEAKPEQKLDATTVREVIDGFLADVEPRAKPKTVATYRYLLGPFRDRFGSRPAAGLLPHEAETYGRKPSWSASTRHDFLLALVSAFRWAERSRLIASNPLAGVRKPPKASRGAKAVLTDDEAGRLLKAASTVFGQFLRGLWLTGCRPSELARLTAADVDFGNGVAILTDHKTADKTGRPRVIYFPPRAVALLRKLAKAHPTGPLFRNSRGGAWTGWAVVKSMEAARLKAGVHHATSYSYRHSFATSALAAGVPDAQVAALLGHSGTATLHRHYDHLVSQARALRAALERVRS